MINFNYQNAQFDYEPYPICYIPNFMDAGFYKTLQETYPTLDKFKFIKGLGNKYSLAEKNNRQFFFDHLKQNEPWQEFYNIIKTKKFVNDTLMFLREHYIDIGVRRFFYTRDMKKNKRGPLLRVLNKRLIRSRFEYSIMGANGGNILPHTDTPRKMITLVLSFIAPGEWNEAWGGGTDVVKPIDRTKTFAPDGQLPHEEVEHVKTFPFQPNQALMFVKTYNSWHSVPPINGPEGALRKTVTINIENIA